MSPKIKRRIFYSLLISLLIHFGFVVWSLFVKMAAYNNAISTPAKVIRIKLSKSDESLDEQSQTIQKDPSQRPLSLANPFSGSKPVSPTPETSDSSQKSISAAIQSQNESPVSSAYQPTRNPKSTQIVDVIASQKVNRSTRTNLVELGSLPSSDTTPGQPVLISGDGISQNFLDKSNEIANALSSGPVQGAPGPNGFEIMKKGSAGGIGKKSQVGDLGSTLIYELYKYQDPKSQEKYFKLVVKVRDATVNFPVIPKEIIFLVDASQSIGQERLNQFLRGLVYSLNHLNSDDRFNILVFKDKTIPFSPTSLAPDVDNIKRAINYVGELKTGSKTDMYNALRASINLPNPFNPSYRILLTDGYPTAGIVNSCQLINETSNINDGRVSIFALSGGVGVSAYMLDFIAYKNRGWSHIVPREYFIGRELSKMYDRIKDPLLLNLRYHLSGLNEQEVFPQVLPDFFKGSEFVIYGNYTTENKFFVQLLGDVSGETKEFALNAALETAGPGDKEIARQWAFHKIYHLIGKLKYNETNESLLAEINSLCARFNIDTPYSKNFDEFPKPKPQPKALPQDLKKDASSPNSPNAPVLQQNFSTNKEVSSEKFR